MLLWAMALFLIAWKRWRHLAVFAGSVALGQGDGGMVPDRRRARERDPVTSVLHGRGCGAGPGDGRVRVRATGQMAAARARRIGSALRRARGPVHRDQAVHGIRVMASAIDVVRALWDAGVAPGHQAGKRARSGGPGILD